MGKSDPIKILILTNVRLTPVVEGRLLPTVPPGLQRVLQHLVGGVDADDLEALLQQHHGIDPGAASDIQYSAASLLSQQTHQEVPIILRTLLNVTDEELPDLRSSAISILIPDTLGWCTVGTSPKYGRIHNYIQNFATKLQ